MQHLLHAIHAIAWKTQNGLFGFETVCHTVKNRYYTAACVHLYYIRGLLHALHVITPPSHPKGCFKPWSVKIPTMFPPFSSPWGHHPCPYAKCHGEIGIWSNKMVTKHQSCKRVKLPAFTALSRCWWDRVSSPHSHSWKSAKCYHGDHVSSMRSQMKMLPWRSC